MNNKMITIRIDKDLLHRFKIAMARNGDKMTWVVIRFITEYVEKSEKENKIIDSINKVWKEEGKE